MTETPDQPHTPDQQPTDDSAARSGSGTVDVAAAERAHRRRTLTTASILLAAAAAALWAASRLTWASLTTSDGLGPERGFTVHGSDWSPWLTPVAIVLVAAIAAAVSLRGWALRITALIVALIGILGVLPAISLLTGNNPGAYAAKAVDVPGRYQVVSVETHDQAAIVVFIGGVIAVAAAVVLLRGARGAAPMSSKYRSPAARRAELEEKVFADRDRTADPAATPGTQAPAASDGSPDDLTERMLWDALDNGADPTRIRPDGRSGGPSTSDDDPGRAAR
ncbi:hypothetical protein ASG12_11945 [Williamsia sp. Leaf354]|jgi:uncharacterized membrane protein (TIGR02234 family)|uniref:TIGR02234 family membrane protein n=1 Tax=Williamsia sp. Leaf354 TaxID=1736349 RepID=UPI0006F5D357|nr:TIGR02234 family membrane protein [Williamsia sp. Leaf354]KQR97781.1 hypothetical protein ASG12_11945 [Williamsia sp. Leaf354]